LIWNNIRIELNFNTLWKYWFLFSVGLILIICFGVNDRFFFQFHPSNTEKKEQYGNYKKKRMFSNIMRVVHRDKKRVWHVNVISTWFAGYLTLHRCNFRFAGTATCHTQPSSLMIRIFLYFFFLNNFVFILFLNFIFHTSLQLYTLIKFSLLTCFSNI
jgi:hypothetical protein